MTATKRANASITSDDVGEFDMILSNGALDRDGDTYWDMNSLVSSAPRNQFEASRLGILAGFSMPRGSSDACPHNLQFLADEAPAEHDRLHGERDLLMGGVFQQVPLATRANRLAGLDVASRVAECNELLVGESSDNVRDALQAADVGQAQIEQHEIWL